MLYARMMQADEPGYRAFQDNYDILAIGIQSPEDLADRLFSKRIITDGIRDKVGNRTLDKRTKTRELLAAVESKLKTEPASFREFVKAIKEDQAYQDIAQKLTESSEKYSAQKTSERERRGSDTHGSRARGEPLGAPHGVCAKGCRRYDKPEQSTEV